MKRYALTISGWQDVPLHGSGGVRICRAETTIHVGEIEAETRDEAIRRFLGQYPGWAQYTIRAEYMGRVRPWAAEHVA